MDSETVIAPDSQPQQQEITGTEEVVDNTDVSSNDNISEPGETSVWDMSDEEFDETNDDNPNLDSDKPTDDTPDDNDEDVKEVSLSDRYNTQKDNVDAKLAEPIYLKHNGEVIEVSSILELKNVAERGFNVTKKLQQISEAKERLEKQIMDAGMDPDVTSDVDALSDNNANEVNDIANRIMSEYAEDFKGVAVYLPKNVQQEMRTNPQLLEALSIDVQSGKATVDIMKQVERQMMLGDISFQQAYVEVIGSAAKQKQSEQDGVENNRNRLQNQPTNTQVVKKAAKSPMDMTDEEFDAGFANLGSKRK